MREKCRHCGGGAVDLMAHEENCVMRPAVVARTEFTQSEIDRQSRKGNSRAVMEMQVYNLRALRGDFD